MKISPIMFDAAALFLVMLQVAFMLPLTQGEPLSTSLLRKLQTTTPTNTTTTTTTTTKTLEECAAQGPGWVPSHMINCDNEQIGTKVECSGCARCICNKDNPPVQGQSCKAQDYCKTYGTCSSSEEITLYACNCASDSQFMCNAAICDPMPKTPPTMTPEECAARGPGWAPSSSVQCNDELIGTKMEDDNGCARCLCNQNNTPSQGQSCQLGDFCGMYGVCCGTEEITMYACNCASDQKLICFAAMCAPC